MYIFNEKSQFSNAFNILFLQGFLVAKIEPKSKDYGDKEN